MRAEGLRIPQPVGVPKFLMLPPDEREIVTWLCSAHGLGLLGSDVLLEGEPHVLGDPLAALPGDLPGSNTGPEEPSEFLFWHPDWAVNSVPLTSIQAVDLVAKRLTAEVPAARDVDVSALLDVATTPVVRLRRSGWQPDGSLRPGALQGMARRTADNPPELLRLIRSVERSLMRRATRVEARTGDGSRLWPLFAFPAAAAWLESGGRYYPWG